MVGPSNTTDLDLFTRRFIYNDIHSDGHTIDTSKLIGLSNKFCHVDHSGTFSPTRLSIHVDSRETFCRSAGLLVRRQSRDPRVNFSTRIDSPAVKWWSRDVQVTRRNEACHQGITSCLVRTMLQFPDSGRQSRYRATSSVRCQCGVQGWWQSSRTVSGLTAASAQWRIPTDTDTLIESNVLPLC